jgi:hypothetical protein
MQVKWMAVSSVTSLLLIGPGGDPAWAQSPPFDYFAVTPCRLLDTRQSGQGPALASGVSRQVTATGGLCGIPASARAIAANITSVASTGGGNLKLYPGDGTVPPTSALNFAAGQTRANNGVFPLAGNGTGSLALLATVTGGGTVHVVLDVTGYFAVPPACGTPSSCPGVDTECQNRTCTAGVCGMNFQPAGTATSTQVPGDCKVNVCNGTGGITAAVDDSDLPNDGNQCTSETCNAGTPSIQNLQAGSACNQSGGSFCDGAGNCVQCNAASDCPGLDTECQSRTCTVGVCGFSFQPAGTVTAVQVAGDCKVNECNGAGGIVPAVDNGDLPNDGNQCTGDVCNAGNPTFPNQPAGTACNQTGGTHCDGAGTCVP